MKLKYKIGSIIEYDVGTQTNPRSKIVLVTEKSRNIKNGLPGFDAEEVRQDEKGAWKILEGKGCWGYDDQIMKVIDLKAVIL